MILWHSQWLGVFVKSTYSQGDELNTFETDIIAIGELEDVLQTYGEDITNILLEVGEVELPDDH